LAINLKVAISPYVTPPITYIIIKDRLFEVWDICYSIIVGPFKNAKELVINFQLF